MRRLAILFTMTLVLFTTGKSSAAEIESWSCSAGTGVTATNLLPDSGPTCSFEVFCNVPFEHAGCLYWITVNANGTGIVAAEMSAEVLGPTFITAEFVSAGATGPEPAPNPSCGPELFNCGVTSELNGPYLHLNGPGLAKVFCKASNIAVAESVSCSASGVVDF